MVTTVDEMSERRSLVVVVGKDSEPRKELARELIDDGAAVVLCAGPPNCPLLRNQPCPLVETADGVVVMPTAAKDPRVVTGLLKCAESASNSFVMTPNNFGVQHGAFEVQLSDPERAAALMCSVLRHPSAMARHAHGRERAIEK
jgi:hypothetical protein